MPWAKWEQQSSLQQKKEEEENAQVFRPSAPGRAGRVGCSGACCVIGLVVSNTTPQTWKPWGGRIVCSVYFAKIKK